MSTGYEVVDPNSPREWAHQLHNVPSAQLIAMLDDRSEACRKKQRRKHTGIKLILQERGVIFDKSLATMPENYRREGYFKSKQGTSHLIRSATGDIHD